MKKETRIKRRAIYLIWILLGLPSLTILGQDEVPFETSFRGQLKPILGAQHLRQDNLYPESTVYYNENRLRLSGSLSKSWFYLELANETRSFVQRENKPAFPLPTSESIPFWDAKWKLQEEQNSSIVTRMDRAFVQASFDSIEIRLGKQIVPIGIGHIFSAISQTPRYVFVVVDPEYDKTEDAATLIWKKGLKFEARYLPRNVGQENDNWHLRWIFNLGGADNAVIVGQSDDKHLLGMESTRSLGDGVVRAEAILYEKSTNYFAQALMGFDRVWNSKWSTKHELFYNGFERNMHRSSNFSSKYYFGNLITYEWSAKLKINFLAIANLKYPSFLLHLFLNYSLSDNVDLILGHYQNIKTKEDSEFGGKQVLLPVSSVKAGLPDLTYLLLKWTF